MTQSGRPALSLDRLDAVVFDTDGVLTDTARVHAAAWAELFDAYLRGRTDRLGERFRPFTPADEQGLVDGRPRYDGVAAFLGSRGIALPWGDPADPPDRETVCGLGNAKDRRFAAQLLERIPTVVDASERRQAVPQHRAGPCSRRDRRRARRPPSSSLLPPTVLGDS